MHRANRSHLRRDRRRGTPGKGAVQLVAAANPPLPRLALPMQDRLARPGAIAPNLDLRSTAGRSFNLASQRAAARAPRLRTLSHRNQIRALHKDAGRFRGVSIGSIVVVVAHQVDEAARVNGSTVSTSVLVDPGGTASSRYATGDASQTARTAGSSGVRTTGRATPRRTIPVDVLLDQLTAAAQNRPEPLTRDR